MAITAQVYVTHPDLALAHTVRTVSGADISVVSDAGTDPHNDVYFFWIEAPDFDAVERALEADHTVASFTTILDDGDRRAYGIEYSPDAKLLSPPMTEIGAVTVAAESHRDGWLLELRLQDHEGLHELTAYAESEGMSVDILELQQTEVTTDRTDFGLTEPQREALIAAFVNGHYDEPRETFLEDLAELLGISQTAVSGRLRRGSARLIEEVLVDEEPE